MGRSSCQCWHGALTGELSNPTPPISSQNTELPQIEVLPTPVCPSGREEAFFFFFLRLSANSNNNRVPLIPSRPYSQWPNWTDNLQLIHLLWRQDTGIFTSRSSKPQSTVRIHGEKYFFFFFCFHPGCVTAFGWIAGW